MTIQLTIRNQWIEARKSGDKLTAENLGMAFDAMQKAAKKLMKDVEQLTENEAVAALRIYEGQLKEEKAGFLQRLDLDKVNAIQAKIDQVSPYIPALLEYDDVKALVSVLIRGVNGKGEAMKIAHAELKDRADGKLVSQVVNEVFGKV